MHWARKEQKVEIMKATWMTAIAFSYKVERERENVREKRKEFRSIMTESAICSK